LLLHFVGWTAAGPRFLEVRLWFKIDFWTQMHHPKRTRPVVPKTKIDVLFEYSYIYIATILMTLEGIPPCSIPHDFPHGCHIFQSEIREATSRSRPEPNFTKASIL
jgi:hypothetical protein